MNRFLSALLALVLISCGPRYPVLTDPVDPRPLPVNPPVVEPVPVQADAIPASRFDSFKVNETRLEEVHYLVGKGMKPNGEIDDTGTLWYFYNIIRLNGKAGDAVLGFTKDGAGNWILTWKHVGY